MEQNKLVSDYVVTIVCLPLIVLLLAWIFVAWLMCPKVNYREYPQWVNYV